MMTTKVSTTSTPSNLMVHSYVVDFERVSSTKCVGRLLILLVGTNGGKTFLCQLRKTLIANNEMQKAISVSDFLPVESIPIPFEDVVQVDPGNLDSNSLNRIDRIRCCGGKFETNVQDVSSDLEDIDISLKNSMKRRYLNQQPDENVSNSPAILRVMPPSCDPDYWFSDEGKVFGLNDIFVPSETDG